MSYFNSITQNVIADPNNSSTANLSASGTFTGSATSTLGITGIQVSLYTTQNCSVWVEQSPDGNNWDISDLYYYFSGINNFGITTQAVNSYVRVRVQNTGIITTTAFRLQTALCPIVEALPRSLTSHGELKVSVSEIVDDYGFEVENTPTDEMRVVIPYRLVGSTFSGSVLDTNYWITSSGSASGCLVPSGAQVVLTTGSFSGGSTVLQSVRIARYLGGAANKARMVMRLPDTGTTGNTRRWGAFTSTDGAFFELSGSTLRVVTRKTSIDTPVNSGAFNGRLGSIYALNTNVKTYEIYWTNSNVYFVIESDLVHTVNASANTWSDTLHLPIRIEDVGSSGSSVNMNLRVATIYRLGSSLSQSTSFYFASGQTAGTNLKIGPGNLHSVVVNSVTNNAVMTLADSRGALTPIITAMTASNTTTTPYMIDFGGLPFFNGLTLGVTTANASLTIVYE